MLNQLKYKLLGPQAILIEWPAMIDEEINKDIVLFKEKVLHHQNDQIEDCIIGYHSLTILYKTHISDFTLKTKNLASIYMEPSQIGASTKTLWEIPVCYDEQFGIDLTQISKKLDLSEKEIISLHSEAIYTIFFIGFLPGFLYLGGMNQQLFIARKATPRLNVPKGSVAIGGMQTGIYPADSAGGWHIIGKTPISFFEPNRANPCFAQAGDKVKFIPISSSDLKNLELEISSGIYQLKTTLLND